MSEGAAYSPSARRFLTAVTILALAEVAAMVYAGTWIHHNQGVTKAVGWTALTAKKAWIVGAVENGGPASGRLQPGDRILSIDGDMAAARIGPSWFFRDRPHEQRYQIEVARGGARLAETLDWPERREPYQEFWLWAMLVIALGHLAPGLLIAFAKPDDEPGRRAVVAGFLSSAYFIGMSMSPRGGMLDGFALPLAVTIISVTPFHVMAGYRFTAGFPAGDFRSPAWSRFESIYYAACVVSWIPYAYVMAIRATGPLHATAIAAAQYPWPTISERVSELLILTMLLVGACATTLACRRNYGRLGDADQKRRMRWVILGLVLGVMPLIILFPFLIIVKSPAIRTMMSRVINAVSILAPLCMAYAVIVHRALGIRVVVRAGLRYLLARNSLRVAIFIPLAWTVIAIILNPQRTFGDLAMGMWGKLNLALLALSALGLKYRTSLLDRIDRRFFRESYQQDQIFISLAEAIGRAADVVEISQILSSQIQSALHPRKMFALSKESADEFAVVFSSSVGDEQRMEHFGLNPAWLNSLESSAALSEESSLEWSDVDRNYLKALGIQLMVPIRGPNEGLIGVMLLGSKMSEEPYSPNDRRLLDTAASQAGVAWENLQLHERLSREQQIRQQVVAGMDGKTQAFVLECPACGLCYDSDATVCGTDGRTLSPSLPVHRILEGKYKLARRIGRGGMGTVYEAEDLRLDRRVAVKVMMERLFGDAHALRRFSREARASAKLDHPNVVRIFDFGELTGGGAYLVLEYLRGVPLRRSIREHRAFAPQAAALLIDGMFRGVEAAHARGVIHRDLKPDNVFLVTERLKGPPHVKILDFGLAAVRDLEFSGRAKLTRTGSAMGTLGYMSREQFMGETVDERSDIY